MKKIKITLGVIIALSITICLIWLGNRRKIEAEIIESKNGITTFEDITGNIWEIENDNYSIGDKVILTFNDKGTDFLSDDEIIGVELN